MRFSGNGKRKRGSRKWGRRRKEKEIVLISQKICLLWLIQNLFNYLQKKFVFISYRVSQAKYFLQKNKNKYLIHPKILALQKEV